MTFPQAFNAVCARYELSAESRAVAWKSAHKRNGRPKVVAQRIYLQLARTVPPFRSASSQ